MSSNDKNVKYHFTYMPKKKLEILNEKTVMKPCLKKWGMDGRIQSQSFAFNESVHPQDMNRFLQEFFTSPDVYPYLQSDPSHPIGQPLPNLTLTRVPCSLTNMLLLARLTNPANGIVMREYDLRQCLHTEVDGFLIADKLRKLLLDPDEEETPLFTDAERSEFLFCLFKHLCLGGQWCQYEDSVEPYLKATKLLYKDLIRYSLGQWCQYEDSLEPYLKATKLLYKDLIRNPI
uniref:Cilia- and flagella-associated protein 300 n=1 Tax=Cacopsylla melanoneura TaxID=428564 RepID=A0A8D9FB86_9HEMI